VNEILLKIKRFRMEHLITNFGNQWKEF